MPFERMNPQDSQGVMRVADGGTIPDDPFQNYSMVLGYTGSNITTITKTLQGVSWVKTLTYSGSNVTAVSAWVRQ
jgi:hypothetical protein